MRDATDETRSYHIDDVREVLNKHQLETKFFDELEQQGIMYISFEVGDYDELAY